MRAMAVTERSSSGLCAMNSPIRTPVSAKRLLEFSGVLNWPVAVRRVEIVGIPYVYNMIYQSIQSFIRLRVHVSVPSCPLDY